MHHWFCLCLDGAAESWTYFRTCQTHDILGLVVVRFFQCTKPGEENIPLSLIIRPPQGCQYSRYISNRIESAPPGILKTGTTFHFFREALATDAFPLQVFIFNFINY